MKPLLLLLLSLPLFSASLVIDCGSCPTASPCPTDQYFTGGLTGNVVTPGATGDISVRYGTFTYRIPAPPGPSIVTLVFRESGTSTGPNQRKFTVKFNEQPPVLSDYDLYAVAGLSVIRREFQVFSIDGFIHIFFTYSKKAAIVSSIEVAQPSGTSEMIRWDVPGIRQADGSYFFTAPVPTVPVAVIAVYRNGVKQRRYPVLDVEADYSLDPQSVLHVFPNPAFSWSVSDVVTMDYEFRASQ